MEPALHSRSSSFAPVACACVLLAYLLALLSRFRGPLEGYLSYFTDDLFYYVVIAKHLVASGMSSFNGIQLTNGYHPLWLFIFAGLQECFGIGRGFFAAVTLLIWTLVAVTFVQLLRLSKLVSSSSEVAWAAALFSTLYTAVLARTGMEISLALFFLTTFYLRVAERPLELQSDRQCVVTGFIASLAILSRVDACIGVAAYLLSSTVGLPSSLRPTTRRLAAFGLGMVLILAYLVVNREIFGTWLPISGMAKNLKQGLFPSAAVAERLLRFDAINALFTWPSIAVGVLYLLRRRPGLQRPGARVQLASVAHPLAFYITLSCTSDWTIWTWYLYPLAPVVALTVPHLCQVWFAERAVRYATPAVVGIALIGIGVCFELSRPNQEAIAIYAAAKHLSSFSTLHEGRYAMGDRAGTPGFLMTQPVIQLEGLVGDLDFLERLKRRQPLADVFRDLKIRYYVGTNLRSSGGCYVAREPIQAGEGSPRLGGRMCQSPVSRFDFGGFTTLIFDVGPASIP